MGEPAAQPAAASSTSSTYTPHLLLHTQPNADHFATWSSGFVAWMHSSARCSSISTQLQSYAGGLAAVKPTTSSVARPLPMGSLHGSLIAPESRTLLQLHITRLRPQFLPHSVFFPHWCFLHSGYYQDSNPRPCSRHGSRHRPEPQRQGQRCSGPCDHKDSHQVLRC